jgi:ABC-2 type transport system ATP-binding protein
MIVVDHVTKYYGAHPAVRDLDFRIEQGECVGFLGLNGAGKTTTLRLLSCLLLPTSGRVTIRGLDAEEQPHEIRKFIGFLPDQPPLYPEMTVREFLNFAGRLRQMDAARIGKRMPEVVDTCGLGAVEDQAIGTLSHGYRQRVGIAQAIIHEPALLILDEPIQGLDPVQIVEMREMIRALRGRHTILLSTHILKEIEQTCDRILMLHEGKIAAQGSEEDLAHQLGEGAIVEAEVRVSAVETYRANPQGTLQDALAKVPGLGEVTVQRRGDDDVVVVKVRLQRDEREEVAKALVTAGFGLRRLALLSTGLETMFVQLSQGKKKAAGKEDA